MVSFGSSVGHPDGAKDLLHASDIKAYFKDGRISVKSRYLSKPVSHVLFSHSHNNQLNLFGDASKAV